MDGLGIYAGRRRLPPDVRKAQIVRTASEFFAEHGFAGSTRDLAAEIGVTQALLYRYFDTKEALIAAVFDELRDRYDPGNASVLGDTAVPLADRVTAFYRVWLDRVADPLSVRLFMYSALAGYSFHQKIAPAVEDAALKPLIVALRREAGMSARRSGPLTAAEYELVSPIHAAMSGLAIRRHIHRMPMDEARFAAAMNSTAQVCVGGALAVLKAGH
jgi:AcrR family transcriptional regulator